MKMYIIINSKLLIFSKRNKFTIAYSIMNIVRNVTSGFEKLQLKTNQNYLKLTQYIRELTYYE